MTDETRPEPAYDPVPQLPKVEGHKVSHWSTTIPQQRLDDTGPVLHYGEVIVTVTVARMEDLRHPRVDDVITRSQVCKIDETFVLSDGDYIEQLLRSLRLRRLRSDDEAKGRQPLGTIKTDASGVVLTPGDLGDEALPAPPGAVPDEVVVILDNGTRLLWPDEFDDDSTRPVAGDTVEGQLIVELLDAVTGETLGAFEAVPEVLDTDRVRERAEAIVSEPASKAVAAVTACQHAAVLELVEVLEQAGRNRKLLLARTRERVQALTTSGGE